MEQLTILQRGRWALVTGATSGIGRAFAEQLAARGMNLFLVALEAERLGEIAASWSHTFGIEVAVLSLDLSRNDAVQKIRQAVGEKQIDVLVNAAGFGYFGDFGAMSHEQIQNLIQVDSAVIAHMCRLFLPPMQTRRYGAIINVASIAGFLPYPFAALYSAAKSFVRIFTNAIWAENQEKGVKIVALCPGYTKTNFEKVSAEPHGVHLFPGETPGDIARKTLAHLSKNRCTFFTKFSHPWKVFAARCLPSKAFAMILRALMKRSRS